MIKKFIFLLILINSAGSIFMVYSQSSKENVKTHKDWKTYNKNHVTIQYPKDWIMDNSGANGTVFILYPTLDSTKITFGSNINLLTQDLKGKNLNLDKFVDLSLNQIKTLITNSNIIESKRLSIKNDEFQRVVYTGEYGIYKLCWEQVYWVVKDKAYVLTFTTEQNRFEELRQTLEEILNTFRVKK